MTDNLNNNWWLCEKCGQKLGKFIDEDRIEILGTKGQEYEIGFNYILLYCNKCGQKNYIESSIPDDISNASYATYAAIVPEASLYAQDLDSTKVEPLDRDFFNLSQFHRKILLKKLSENQRRIYKLLNNIGKINSQEEWDKTIEKISIEIKLPSRIVGKDIISIYKKIEDLKKNS